MSIFSVLSLIIVMLMPFAFTGCASIVSGTTQSLTFNSNPDGALVTVNGREIGKTPTTVSLKRGRSVPLTFAKPGYKTASMEMTSSLNGWFWGDIICGGVYGSTTDALSGAMHKYSPDQYLVTLSPENTTSIDAHPALSEQQKTKDFIVISYPQIIKELKTGEGEYLKSLIVLLKIPADQKDASTKRIRALSEAYPNIPEFADKVIEAFMK